jgi:hypothetical protein
VDFRSLFEEATMRHLVSLVDGTWLTPTVVAGGNIFSSIHRINVYLQKAAKDGNPQIVFYSRGLGAVSGIRKYTAGGFASNIKEEVEDVYINISANYVEGDKIYLFGFSRGAVIARVVAGLISKVGLLSSWHLDKVPKIWELYEDESPGKSDHAKEYFQSGAKVEFLGVFDTVYGGNNTPEKTRHVLKFVGKRLSNNVIHAVHLMAIDEQRPFFRSLLWENSDTHTSLKQIWMPGVHGDIGGIYPAVFLGDVRFLTMVREVQSKTPLAFDEDRLRGVADVLKKFSIEGNVSINQEWTRFWKVISLGLKHHRKPPPEASQQYRHFITDKLIGNLVNMRAERKRPTYDVPNEFKGLPPYVTSWTVL